MQNAVHVCDNNNKLAYVVIVNTRSRVRKATPSNTVFQAEFSQEQYEAIQATLRQRLGPEFISQRVGAGGMKVVMVFRPYIGEIFELSDHNSDSRVNHS